MLAFLAGKITAKQQQQSIKLTKDGQVTFDIFSQKQNEKQKKEEEEQEPNENKVKSTRYSLKWFLPAVLWEYCT